MDIELVVVDVDVDDEDKVDLQKPVGGATVVCLALHFPASELQTLRPLFAICVMLSKLSKSAFVEVWLGKTGTSKWIDLKVNSRP